MNEFLTWSSMATFAGAATVTGIVVQFTKELPGISKIKTQYWSYIVACVCLFLSFFFTNTLTLDSAALIFLNVIPVSLASNGGFELITRGKTK